ncbi:MAG: hypothetical protein KF723_01595 [Rhizobiaceae bacterium]|nr:hypothetical protein [Rhizobiaceae bacterium]
MGTLLPFVRHGAARPNLAPAAAAGASIIIFPGVRYERTADVPDAPTDNAATSRRAPRGRRKSGRA